MSSLAGRQIATLTVAPDVLDDRDARERLDVMLCMFALELRKGERLTGQGLEVPIYLPGPATP